MTAERAECEALCVRVGRMVWGVLELTEEVRQLIDVLDRDGPVPDPRVDLLAQLAHRLGVLAKVVERERKEGLYGVNARNLYAGH